MLPQSMRGVGFPLPNPDIDGESLIEAKGADEGAQSRFFESRFPGSHQYSPAIG
jgi:hypothetical protein